MVPDATLCLTILGSNDTYLPALRRLMSRRFDPVSTVSLGCGAWRVNGLIFELSLVRVLST